MSEDLNEMYEDSLRTGNSYCSNSDCFFHGLIDPPRSLSDETYARQAQFFLAPIDL